MTEKVHSLQWDPLSGVYELDAKCQQINYILYMLLRVI